MTNGKVIFVACGDQGRKMHTLKVSLADIRGALPAGIMTSLLS